EYIDIGGPSLLRAAAKNYERITVLCHPKDYAFVSQKKELALDDRRRLASRVFAHVSAYDSMVAKTLSLDEGPREFSLGGFKVQNLRYGENPAQSAAW